MGESHVSSGMQRLTLLIWADLAAGRAGLGIAVGGAGCMPSPAASSSGAEDVVRVAAVSSLPALAAEAGPAAPSVEEDSRCSSGSGRASADASRAPAMGWTASGVLRFDVLSVLAVLVVSAVLLGGSAFCVAVESRAAATGVAGDLGFFGR